MIVSAFACEMTAAPKPSISETAKARTWEKREFNVIKKIQRYFLIAKYTNILIILAGIMLK
jgi:hypothetical protein